MVIAPDEQVAPCMIASPPVYECVCDLVNVNHFAWLISLEKCYIDAVHLPSFLSFNQNVNKKTLFKGVT